MIKENETSTNDITKISTEELIKAYNITSKYIDELDKEIIEQKDKLI